MSEIFLLFLLAMVAIFFRKRALALVLGICGIILTLLVFWHHATNILNINL